MVYSLWVDMEFKNKNKLQIYKIDKDASISVIAMCEKK
jgi:hypothetical protein